MQPNLKTLNINNLTLSTTCIIPQNIVDDIQKLSPPIKGISRFVYSYTLNRTSHTCLLTIQEKRKETRQYYIEFDYRLIPKFSMLKRLKKVNQVIDGLCSISDNLRFSCSINISYKKREKRHFLVSLPIKFSESSRLPFDLIDGFSIEGKLESLHYKALIVTNNKGDESWLAVMFSKQYTFDKSLVQNVINDAMAIANILMPQIKKQKDEI